jgi:hypothetical protein
MTGSPSFIAAFIVSIRVDSDAGQGPQALCGGPNPQELLMLRRTLVKAATLKPVQVVENGREAIP